MAVRRAPLGRGAEDPREAIEGEGVIRVLMSTFALTSMAFLATAGILSARPEPMRAIGHGQVAFRGHGPEFWHARYQAEHRRAERLASHLRSTKAQMRRHRRVLLHRPDVLEAMRLSSIAYGVPYRELYAVVSCETGHTFSPRTYNRSSAASGLAQFLPSTFARTPYGGEDIFSPYANALAAGWLWRSDGRSWREWACAP